MRFTTSTETWKAWEGRAIDGKFTLGQWLGGSDHSAVFATELKEQSSSKAPMSKAAIKLIATEPEKSGAELARLREAAQLSHPNLIRIIDVGQSKLEQISLLYVVMEAAEEDLSQILPERALSPEETSGLLTPLLDGLAHIHAKGFVHGHIRPANVHAVSDTVKLSTDRIIPVSDTASTRRRRDVYDAPETAAGILSPAGDIWSIGVTLMAALTQNVPQDGNGSHGDPGLPANIPEPFRGIVRECLHLDPQQRCSLADIQARLSPSAAPAMAVVTRPDAPQALPPASSRNWIFGAVAVIIVVGILFAYWKSSRPPVGQQVVTQEAPSQSAPPTSAAPPPVSSEPAPPKASPASSAEVVHQVLPDISPGARRTVTGTVKIKVRVEVNSAGKVTAAKLAAPAGSRFFADRALRAAKAWEFSAPQTDGQPSASAWLLQFRIQRSGVHASAERITR